MVRPSLLTRPQASGLTAHGLTQCGTLTRYRLRQNQPVAAVPRRGLCCVGRGLSGHAALPLRPASPVPAHGNVVGSDGELEGWLLLIRFGCVCVFGGGGVWLTFRFREHFAEDSE
jgi:hypothetical protein